MADSLWTLIWSLALALAVILTIGIAIFLLTLPKAYSHFHSQSISSDAFTVEDKSPSKAQQSGWAYFSSHSKEDRLAYSTSVQVVVLGDIGRSPRMQYHALSIAAHGGRVELIGYHSPGDSAHPDIIASRYIQIHGIRPFPSSINRLATTNKLFFLLLAPFKVLWQVSSLYYTLSYRTAPTEWMLVQNPPSIPTLAVAVIVCFFRNTRLIIDWHNFGYSILALRLGESHPLVRISQVYERTLARFASAHFAVTDAMSRFLSSSFDIKAFTLHDRPAEIYQPLAPSQRSQFLQTLPETAPFARSILSGSTKLLVSSTSWTPDEDFSVLLSALVSYSEQPSLPSLLVIITGRGPQQSFYLSQIANLTSQGKLKNITIKTAWLTPEAYAGLLASADLGISLHTSSSGVDLPMKVVDMFGAGLPVAGWAAFEAWPELVTEGVNGMGFASAEALKDILVELFSQDQHDGAGGDERGGAWGAAEGGGRLENLRRGARRECQRRWKDEWDPVAGRLLRVVDTNYRKATERNNR